MAFDAFLKIEGIEGESMDDKHPNQIEILSYSFGVSQPQAGTRSSAGSLTAERAQFSDFTVIKALDKASPKLFLGCADGTHYKSAILELCRAGGDKQPYMEYKMTDVTIAALSPGGSSHGGESLPVESISLNFGKIELKYTQTDPKTGKAKGSVAAGWNLEKNVKV